MLIVDIDESCTYPLNRFFLWFTENNTEKNSVIHYMLCYFLWEFYYNSHIDMELTNKKTIFTFSMRYKI